MSPLRVALGYDLRIAPEMQLFDWDEERRTTFLLLRSVAAPLSYDTNVWPSVLTSSAKEALPVDDASNAFSISAEAWPFRAIGFIDDLNVVYSQYPSARDARKFWPIAVEAILEPGEDVTWPILESLEPREFATKEWCFLGYDIIDTALSALMNFGYGDDEYDRLYARFANSLNSNHLFFRYDDALAYKSMCPARDADHAPYFVVALYRTTFPSSKHGSRTIHE